MASGPQDAERAGLRRVVMSLTCGRAAVGTCTWRGRSHSHPHPPTRLLGNLGRAPLALRPPPRVLQAPAQRSRQGCLGDRGARPAHLASPAPASSPASVVPPGEDRRLSTWNILRVAAAKRISPEKTETRERSSASVGNQCSRAARVLMLS